MSLVEMTGISRRFGAVQALDGVALSLAPGTIHGLLGENGAGKTTLMNILYGLVRPDAGEIRVGGRRVRIGSPRDAHAAGIGMVHQHFMLAGAMSVLDNILLGDRRQGVVLDRRRAGERLRQMGDELGLPIDPSAPAESLSVGQQQRVEILKALFRDVKLLILDEPTAVLTPQETDHLLEAMQRLKQRGCAVVFISHKLGEIARVCDRATVLRRGQVVWEGDARQASPADLARQMVGYEVQEVSRSGRTPARGGTLLRLDKVVAGGLQEATLEVGAEILGVAGVDGNGQQELAEVIVGLRPVRSGTIRLGDRNITRLGLLARMDLGISHIPNDRKLEGLVASMSITENLLLKHHRRAEFSRFGLMCWGAARRRAAELAQAYDVRMGRLSQPAGSLSGGNQQKLILARELSIRTPQVVVAMNPSRGLDIAATNFVYEQLLKLREAGCAVLLISSELDELMRLSDRLAVLYGARLTMSRWPDADVGSIGQMMAGVA